MVPVLRITECYPKPNSSRFQSLTPPNPSELLTSDYMDKTLFVSSPLFPALISRGKGLCNERDPQNNNNNNRQLMEQRSKSMTNIHTQ